jgi:hypothetical protein
VRHRAPENRLHLSNDLNSATRKIHKNIKPKAYKIDYRDSQCYAPLITFSADAADFRACFFISASSDFFILLRKSMSGLECKFNLMLQSQRRVAYLATSFKARSNPDANNISRNSLVRPSFPTRSQAKSTNSALVSRIRLKSGPLRHKFRRRPS